MGDESSSQLATRKMKFTPKIPPRKEPKPATPKTEPPEATANDVIDHKLLRLVKHAEQASGRRMPKERKVAPVQVAFGHEDAGTSSRSFDIPGSGRKHQVAPVQVAFVYGDTGPSSRSFDIPGNGHKQQDVADGSAPKKEKEYVEPWDYHSYYPTTLPLRRPYSGNSEVLDEKEFGKVSESSIYDETCINTAKELGLMDGEESQMIFLQLPASLPLAKQTAAAKGKVIDGQRGHVLKKGCSLEDLAAGFMGKLLVYKSGIVKMKLGEALFDVSPGSNCLCAQDVMAINTQEKHCCVLGELNKRAIVTPDVDSLLDSVIDLD